MFKPPGDLKGCVVFPIFYFLFTILYFRFHMTPERKHRLETVLNKRQGNITVLLENVFDPHNISAVMRTCDAIGMLELYVLNTRLPAHKKWGPKSSSSAHKWLDVHQFTDAEKCFRALRQKYARVFTTHLETAAIPLYELNFTEPIALVFGNEHAGVSQEIRKLADGNFIIPQVGMIRSLNISVACAVTLYEAFRQKSLAGHYKHRQLDDHVFNGMLGQWGLNEHDE